MDCRPDPSAATAARGRRLAARRARAVGAPIGARDSLFFGTSSLLFPGAHVEAPHFDAELQTETTTIMFADVVESVRLIEQDEAGNVARIRTLLRHLAQVTVPAHQGVVLERRGDGLLIRFADSRCAAACALALHRHAAEAGAGSDTDDTIALRVGIHCAEVIVDQDAIYGRGINVAARVTTLAGPGETALSDAVRDRLTDALDGELHDLGECFLKNVVEPVRAYRLHPVTAAAAHPPALPAGVDVAPDQRATLAVLPLNRERVDPSVLSGADVFVDQLTSALSQSPVLRVISRLSTHAFRGRDIERTLAGATLRAHYVLGGHCSESDGHLSAHLELLHSASGQLVWEQDLACSKSDLLGTDSDVLARAVAAVMNALTQTELTVAHGRPLPNLAAHTLYLSAVTLLHRFSRTDFDRARLMLEALRDRAPRNAAPPAWLARWHVFRIVQGWSNDVRRDGAQASDFAKRALDHDPKSSLALAMAGSVEAGVNRDMSAARGYYDLALASNPNEPLAWLLKGVAHGFMGDAVAAMQSSEQSLMLTPLDPMRFYYDSLSSSAALGAQDYRRTIELAQRAIRANCMHGSAYRALAIAQVLTDAVDAARETVARLLAVEPNSSVQQFLARAAVNSEKHQVFARALASAGLPAG
jgi:adenylate cyclase